MNKVEFKKSVEKKSKKLDKNTQIMLIGWIKKNLVDTAQPRIQGKALKGDKKELWRYRVGNSRILAEIIDNGINIILIINIDHRKNIYK